MKDIKQLILTLALLITAATGAMATTVTWVTTDFYDTGSAAFTKYDVTVTPSNNDARYSNFFYNNGANTFTTTLGNFTKIEIVFKPSSSPITVSGWNYELIEAVQPEPDFPEIWEYTSKLTWTGDAESVSIQGAVYSIKSITFTIAEPSSGPEVDWDKAKNSGSFTMPGGNVTLEPEYYPQAELTAKPTAINDVPATTDGAIVNAGTVKNIGETTTAQGTVMYYVSPSALDDADLLALAADKWTADVPTAAGLSEGPAYVYYYVRGNDGDTDETTFSDGDILAANALTVTIAAEPTYAVTFADDLTEPDKWTADPAANVTKGKTVTVTYTGTKKVIGVKAEKKAKAPAETTVTLTPGEIGDLSIWGSPSKTINGITIAISGDSSFNTAGLMQVSGYDPETGEPISATGTFTFTSSVGNIKRIDINHNSGRWWGSGAGWPGSYEVYDTSTFTWSGTPAASVTLSGSFSDEHDCSLYDVSSFVFTIEPTN